MRRFNKRAIVILLCKPVHYLTQHSNPMIIYGTRSKLLAKQMIPQKCSHCGTSNSVDLYVFQKYAHVFWIPFFPIGKTGANECSHCQQVLQLKQMPDTIKASYTHLRSQEKTPLWMFTGLALLAVLVVAGVVTSKQKEERNAHLIAAPHQGDIFEVRTDAQRYTLYKVHAVKGDSAFLQLSSFETNKKSGLYDLKAKGETAFTEELYAFSTAELKEMVQKGEIIDIERQ